LKLAAVGLQKICCNYISVKFRNRTVFIAFLGKVFIFVSEAILSAERRVLLDVGELWKRTIVIIFEAIV
jgi:hypothetical protein